MKKILLCAINFSFILFLSGCLGGYRDIDKLNTASAVGIDKTEDGYRMTIQSVNASSLTKNGGKNAAPVVVYSADGKSVFDALRILGAEYFPSQVFMAHFRLLAFGEEMAKSGILQTMLFLYNDAETRQRYNIVVVKGGTAEDLLKIITPVNKNPAAEINGSIESAQRIYGNANIIYSDDIIACMISKQSNPVVTSVEIEGDPKKGEETKNTETTDLKTKIKVNGLSVFHDEKLVGYLDQKEAIGFNYIMGDIVGTIETVPLGDEGQMVTFEVTGTQSKVDFKNNIIKVKVSVEGSIATSNPGKLSFSKEEIKEIEKKVDEAVKEKMDKVIKKTQEEYDTDIFRFGKLINRKKPQYWKKIEKEYDSIYPTLKIETDVKTTVKISRI